MRNSSRAVAALALAGFALMGAAPTGADPAAPTVADLYADWTDQAAGLETTASATQRLGDASLAQRQFLLAAMTRRVAGEFRNAEQYRLTAPIASLPAPIPERLGSAMAALAEASRMTDANATAALKDAQVKFNAVLAASLSGKTFPILYGMLARDISNDPAAEPADLMIYGYDVVDAYVGKKPVVSVDAFELPEAMVSVKDDVALITLPPEVKTAIGFAPSPCDERKTFGLRARSFYATKLGFWPLTWKSEQFTISEFNALATPIVFAAKVTYSFDSMQDSALTETFKRKSSFVSADCDRTVSTAIAIDLPPGSHDVTCQARWVDTSSSRSADARCTVAASGAKAEGTLAGLAKICTGNQLCSCVSSAHGWLEATGTYQRHAQALGVATRTLSETPHFGPDGSASATLPLAAGETLRSFSLAFSKRACPVVIDTLDVPTTDGLGPSLPASSRTGAFRARYRAGKLEVGGAGADAFNSAPSQ